MSHGTGTNTEYPCSSPNVSQQKYRESSYYSTERDSCDDSYDDGSDRDSTKDQLDFSNLKLYGRGRELQVLHDVYSHVIGKGVNKKKHHLKMESSVVIIRGLSGTGKTTLTKQFIEDLDQKSKMIGGPTKPYFLSGKYDELSGGAPFSAIVEAFSGFAESLLLDLENAEDNAAEIQRIRDAIKNALGDEARMMANMVPSLRHLIVSKDDDNSIGSFPSDQAWNRLKYALKVFTSAISTAKRPVIMFLDDLQWSDSASLELLESLLTDKDLRHFMFIGSYRSNEMQPCDEQMIEEISKARGMKEIELTNLSLLELNDFVAAALELKEEDRDRAMSLTKAIHGMTGGNIFFTIQLLEELQRKGFLRFSRSTCKWDWNLDTAFDGMESDDVIATVTSKIKSSPDLLQTALVLMAYSRSTVDIETLRRLLEMDGYTIGTDDLVKLLDKGVLNGLLDNQVGSDSYSFAHDSIKEASYGMIPSGKERDEFRFSLGRRLYNIASAESLEKNWILFAAVDHLNAACIQLKCLENDPLFLIKLNLKAGTKAASIAAFEMAAKFLGLAMENLKEYVKDPWEKEYDITLKVHQGVVNAEFCRGNFEVGRIVAHQVLSHSKKPEDKLPTQIALSKALDREFKHPEGYELARSAIRKLGIIPKSSIRMNFNLVKDMAYVKKYFKNHTDEEILNLPIVRDEKLVSTMKMILSFSTMAYYCNRQMECFAGTLQQLRRTFKHGLHPTTPLAIFNYCVVSQAMNDTEGAERFSCLAMNVFEKVKSKEIESLVCFLAAFVFHAWKDPHDKVIEIYQRGEKVGMENGDFEVGLRCCIACAHYKIVCGFPLHQLDLEFKNIMERIERYKIISLALSCTQQHLLVRHLMGSGKIPIDFDKLGDFGSSNIKGSDNYPLIFGCLGRIQIGIHYGEYSFAEKMIDTAAKIWEMDDSYQITNLRFFFCSIVYATLARQSEGFKKKKYLKKAKNSSAELKAACKLKGMKCYHRYLLTKAHISAAEGTGTRIPDQYNKAITNALKNGHLNDAALGRQLAAEYALDLKDSTQSSSQVVELLRKFVRENLEQARDLYLKWGAKGVVGHLETKYNAYLESTVGLFDDQSTIGDTVAFTFDSFGDEMDYDLASEYRPRSFVGSRIIDSQGKTDDVSILTSLSGGYTSYKNVS